ncbi:uncharacterized protein LOC119072674 [Bradysia coprophila]|uniref:uncharacterized protein LOC119072674 n=1 Tax=Bradysia coprophila TaxID=38358 RepID=UPI00187DB72F|nr:uncharacterized protein LOC119072674 [Bradysia coprophila]
MEYPNKIPMSGSFGGRTKRSNHGKWNEAKHVGVKILIVTAVFTVVGLIILSEILMNDEQSKISKNGGVIQAMPWGQLLPPSIERTLPPYPDKEPATDGSWKFVNGTKFKFFVFSAFYDRRGGNRLIRVIGATKTRGTEKVWCRLWYPVGPNNSTFESTSVMARVQIIRENWDLKYSACFVLCPLQAPGLEVPYAVSIVSKIRSPPGNVLLLRNTDQDSQLQNRANINQIPDQIGVCIKPFHYDYDSALHLLEFLELYSLLGVSHFTFYNHTLGPDAACVLRHYIDEGLANIDTLDGTGQRPTVSMLQWDLKMQSQKEIRTEGLFAAFNDCLYRSMYRFQYVVFVDVDEFIVPRRNDTLKDLLKWLSLKPSNINAGAYSFQNAFFYLQFADDSLTYERNVSNAALRSALLTQRKTRRRLKLHPHRERSKYICKPQSVVEVGNHFVWEFMPGQGHSNVTPDIAILHHYRVCEYGGDDCVNHPSTVDRTAHKYSHRLTDRVEMMYSKLKTPCKLLDVPPVPTKAPEERK